MREVHIINTHTYQTAIKLNNPSTKDRYKRPKRGKEKRYCMWWCVFVCARACLVGEEREREREREDHIRSVKNGAVHRENKQRMKKKKKYKKNQRREQG